MSGSGHTKALWVALAIASPLAAAAASAVAEPVAVVTGAGDQTAPSVSAGQLAYADDASGARQVWVKDLLSGAVTRQSGAQVVLGGPVLDHGILAFTTPGGVEVLAFDDPGLSTSIPAVGAAGVSASALLVAWEQPGAGGRDVALLQVGTAAPLVLAGAGDEHAPAVSYGWLAWLDESGAGAIRLRDPGGAVTTPYPGRAREVSLWASSRLASPLLAAAVETGTGGALVVLDAAGLERGRLARPVLPLRPRLGNEWVAFEDLSTGTSQVALWQWTTGRLVVPSPTGQAQILNDLRIENQVMRLAWADGRGGDLDVYLFESALPLPDLPVGQARCDDPLAPVLADLLVRQDGQRSASGAVGLSLPARAPVLTCIDAVDVCEGWVQVGGALVAQPADFGTAACGGRADDDHDRDDHDRGDHDRDDHDRGDHDRGDHDRDRRDHHPRRGHDDGRDDHGRHDRQVACVQPAPTPVQVHLEARLEVPAGDGLVEATVAGGAGRGSLRVRVLADGWQTPPRTACIAGVDCADPPPPSSCSSPGAGGVLGLLLVPILLGRASRRRRE